MVLHLTGDCGICEELKHESQQECKRVCTDLDLSDGKLWDFVFEEGVTALWCV